MNSIGVISNICFDIFICKVSVVAGRRTRNRLLPYCHFRLYMHNKVLAV